MALFWRKEAVKISVSLTLCVSNLFVVRIILWASLNRSNALRNSSYSGVCLKATTSSRGIDWSQRPHRSNLSLSAKRLDNDSGMFRPEDSSVSKASKNSSSSFIRAQERGSKGGLVGPNSAPYRRKSYRSKVKMIYVWWWRNRVMHAIIYQIIEYIQVHMYCMYCTYHFRSREYAQFGQHPRCPHLLLLYFWVALPRGGTRPQMAPIWLLGFSLHVTITIRGTFDLFSRINHHWNDTSKSGRTIIYVMFM